MMQISQFLNVLCRNYGRKITRSMETIYLCPAHLNMMLLVQDVILLLEKIANPQHVTTIILYLGWMALGDKKLLSQLKRFTNVKKLHLRGRAEDGVFYGFDNAAIRSMAKSFSNLTHLFIQGHGMRSFHWSSLSVLLKRNAGITTLTLGKIRGVLDLKQLDLLCPLLETLTFYFHVDAEYPLQQRIDLREALRMQDLGLQLQGDFETGFKRLENLYFYEDHVTEWLSRSVISRLIQSIPVSRFVDPSMADMQGFTSGQLIQLHPSSGN